MGAGHHRCSPALPFPNKTWFHIALPASPLTFSIAVVFITHDISFSSPLAETHSSYTPVTCTSTLNTCPRWHTKPLLALHSQLSGGPARHWAPVCCTAAREKNVNGPKKGRRSSSSPSAAEPHPPPRCTPHTPQGFPFAESLNGLGWGQLELEDQQQVVGGQSSREAGGRGLWGVEFWLLKLGAGEGGRAGLCNLGCLFLGNRDPHPSLSPLELRVSSLLEPSSCSRPRSLNFPGQPRPSIQTGIVSS